MTNEKMCPIYTIDARDHLLLGLTKMHGGYTTSDMREIICSFHLELLKVLKKKKISYEELRHALSPGLEKNEAVFIFDSRMADSGLYGNEFMDKLMPLIDPRTVHSFLHGDLIGNDDVAYDIFCDSLVIHKGINFEYASNFYGIYVNNISSDRLGVISEGLKREKAYIGYMDMTYSSRSKIFMSACLTNAFLKKVT